jgi:hypothetical protein
MSFKDQVVNDNSTVFMNTDEFAEMCTINGKEYLVLIDNDRLQHRSKVEYEGVAVGDTLYFIKADAFAKMPKVDDVQVFGGVPCTVFDVRPDNGMLEIILKKNVG